MGMPVVAAGRKLGRVSQVSLADDLSKVKGLFIDCGLHGTRLIEDSHIDMLGEVAVLARDSGRRASCDVRPLMRRAITTDGARIGAITDASIDERTLKVLALEFSQGYLDDLTAGRRRIWQFSVVRNGDVIIDQAASRPEGGRPQ
jgi:uncharacterized protein YrrD